MSQDNFTSSEFCGTARLFPLPNLVLFPHVAQPLHIFEPRYRQLMADALADDRLIAMALLCPGWEEEYHKRPPIHPMVCLGRILQEEPLESGRYNLLLQGVCRARVVEEVPTDRLYRHAHVELFPDDPADASSRDPALRRKLGDAVIPFFAAHPTALEQLRGLLAGDLALGTLCDIFSFALPLEPEAKQALLEECDVRQRVAQLLTSLEGRAPPGAASKEPPRKRFPPEFSPN